MADPLVSLLQASHLLAPGELGAVAAEYAAGYGVRTLVLYLADYEQRTLLPLTGSGVPERQELPMTGTLAGLAFRRVEPVTGRTDTGTGTGTGTVRLWLPLLDGVERLGVAELELAGEPDAALTEQLRAYVTLIAELLVVNDAYTDVFARVRRRRVLSLAAELQWDLLPPLSFGTRQVTIAGGLEPAYDIGGDTFDYAVNDTTADLIVLDAVGHGLHAAVLASVAVAAYRHARRDRADLPEIAEQINTAIADQFPAAAFATAVIARLDLDTGRLRWINAGHPEPLIIRGPALVHPPHCPPARPLGLQDAKPVCCQTRLEPGDRLLLYTDGITEARSPDGDFFGEARLADFIATAAAAAEPAPETVHRLMRQVLIHQADQLQDDASLVLLDWRPPNPDLPTW